MGHDYPTTGQTYAYAGPSHYPPPPMPSYGYAYGSPGLQTVPAASPASAFWPPPGPTAHPVNAPDATQPLPQDARASLPPSSVIYPGPQVAPGAVANIIQAYPTPSHPNHPAPPTVPDYYSDRGSSMVRRHIAKQSDVIYQAVDRLAVEASLSVPQLYLPTPPPQAGSASVAQPSPPAVPAPTFGGKPKESVAWPEILDTMSESDVRELLACLAKESDLAATRVHARYEDQKSPERDEIIDFSHVAHDVYSLLERNTSNRDMQERQNAHRVTSGINSIIESIACEVSHNSAYETKQGALSALCDIGDSVLEEKGSRLGSEVRKHIGYDNTLTNAMRVVLGDMAVGERTSASETTADGTTFYKRMEDLAAEAEGYVCFTEMGAVLALLRGEGDSEGEDDEG